MSIKPAQHTRLVKEALTLGSMLGVCLWVWGGWERGKQFQQRWQLLEEWMAEKPETESCTKPGTRLSAQHPPKWPWAYVVSTPVTETSFPNVFIPS